MRYILMLTVFCALCVSGSLVIVYIWSFSTHSNHAQYMITETEFIFSVGCCLVSYLLASVLVFYTKSFLQNLASPWLMLSLIGSVFFSILLTVFDYINTINEIKNYKKPSFWISGDFGPPELPTFEELILFVFVTSVAAFLNTSLIYFLWRDFYAVFFAKRCEINSDL